jgi:acetyl esterase/lipase
METPATNQEFQADLEIEIWDGEIPGPKTDIEEIHKDGRVYNVKTPKLELFSPPGQESDSTAVIICPGGGYGGLAIEKEGYKIARRFNSSGITAFVLTYRLKEYGYPWPMCDLQQAIRVVRARAPEFNISPEKIGVAGFSAGGHLAGSISVHWRYDFLTGKPATENLRPDFTILGYPVVSFQSDITHAGSRINLLGSPADPNLTDKLSCELHIDNLTPPAFIFHAGDDRAVSVENSIRYYQGINKAGTDGQLHIFDTGGHGFGLGEPGTPAAMWPRLCTDWLININLADEHKNGK